MTKPGMAQFVPLHLLVLGIVAVAELIGIVRIPIGVGTVILLPILYASRSASR